MNISLAFLRHLYRLARSGQLRFRLETYGLYYPALPGHRHPLLPSPGALVMFLRSLAGYAQWWLDMDRIAVAGPHQWWGRRWPCMDVEGELTVQSAPPEPCLSTQI
ncbi:MAG TPA: hypothetical protein VFB34_00560 [Chloroflexota bacterium]|nr:hypothetical protein [Chloroflexota bacterium]